MHLSKVLMVAAALTFAVASVGAAQGARAQGPKTRPTQAQGPKTQPPPQAQGPRAPRAGSGQANRPEQANRGNRGNQEGRAIAENIARNPQQAARLQAMLPAGMTLEQASAGFRNQGQFIAALEASKNQNIPFADLKAKMTGNNPLSLGQAIQELRPAATTGTNQ
jgi:hypothetical protein